MMKYKHATFNKQTGQKRRAAQCGAQCGAQKQRAALCGAQLLNKHVKQTERQPARHASMPLHVGVTRGHASVCRARVALASFTSLLCPPT